MTAPRVPADRSDADRPSRALAVTNPPPSLVETRNTSAPGDTPGLGGGLRRIDTVRPNWVLAIDPGPVESAWCGIDKLTRRPLTFGKVPNAVLRDRLRRDYLMTVVAVEMIQSYGMPVGHEVFETCVWIGRFVEIVLPIEAMRVYRADVKLHHCRSTRAADAHVKQALIDRFASGVRNHGKGTKADPGWFHGFKADVWQAYALAVYVADTRVGG